MKSARLYICGLGLYEAYFLGENKENHEKIGDEYLTPYCNNYDQWIQYQTYDITEQAERGGVLSVLLGNGWYKGRFGFNDPEREAYYGDEWKLIAEVHIEYKDGTKDVISSDETWSVTRSNLWFSISMMVREEMIRCRRLRSLLRGSQRLRKAGLWNGYLFRLRYRRR